MENPNQPPQEPTKLQRAFFWLFIVTVYALFLWVMLACSPVKRMERIIRRNPHLVNVRDTLRFTDTIPVMIPGVRKDCTYNFFNYRDTLIFKENHLTIKSYFNFTDSTHYIFGSCDTIRDTLIREHVIPVPVVQVKNTLWKTYVYPFLLIVGIMVLLSIVYWMYRKPRDGLRWF
jgi:hypothetical protein